MTSLSCRRRDLPFPARIFFFYYDGFKQMTLGKTLWKIIFIKLLIMFGILKIFFFPDFLASNFDTDRQRADYVLEQLITAPAPADLPVTKEHEGDLL